MMTTPLERDDKLAESLTSAVYVMIVAARAGDQLRFIGEKSLLHNTVIDLAKTLDERPADEALRRAVARLNAGPGQP